MDKKSSVGVSRAEEDAKIIHDFSEASHTKKDISGKNLSMNSSKPPIILFVILLLLGIGTGFLVNKVAGSPSVTMVGPDGKIQTGNVSKGEIVGSDDTKTFNDTVEGVLREGGIDGEGAYHLERPGGESQNVYLTSSIVDLSSFVGKKVKVWGQTNNAQTAGWLMDVGRLQLL